MRYLPQTDADRSAMLDAIGVSDVAALFAGVPAAAQTDQPFDLPFHKSEMEVERIFRDYAAANVSPANAPCFLGAGTYRHHIPAAVDHIIQRGEFLTAYTPYQPEVAQGTLQYLFEFQTQVALLTGMEVANASMYDGATAASEAMMMATRLTKRNKAVFACGVHPHYLDTCRTTARFQGLPVDTVAATPDRVDDVIARIDENTACVVVQTPDVFGRLHDLRPIAEAAHAKGALLVAVVTEVVSLGALEPPGAQGADIVAGEGQSIGVPTGFGGPHVGLFAVRAAYLRQMPGRVAGATVDADGKPGYVLTLSTREQHIRRGKATSNICTNSGLCALAFTVHLSLLGEAGLTRLAQLNHACAVATAEALVKIPEVRLLNDVFFNEFTVLLPKPAAETVDALASKGILAGVPLSRLYPDRADLANHLLVAATETVSVDDIAALCTALREVL